MGVNKRSSIKVDIPQEIQTGQRFEVNAIIQKDTVVLIVHDVRNVLPGGLVSVLYFPPVGTRVRIMTMTLVASPPLLAGSGYHYFSGTISPASPFCLGASIFSSALEFRYNHWLTADYLQYPPDPVSLALSIAGTEYNNSYPFEILYSNNTNVTQTIYRIIEVIFEETK